jgi:hypothetical protein
MSEPRIPSHRFYQKQNHVKLAREDKDKSVIRDSGIARIDGGGVPPIVGTHAMLVGTQGGAYGFADGIFGDLTPSTIDGFEVSYLQEAADILRLSFIGDVQLAGATIVSILGAWPGAQTLQLVWSPGTSAYVSPVLPDLNNWFAAQVGNTIQLNIAHDGATLSEQVEAMLAGTASVALDPRDFSTMWQDAAGTVPVTADNQPVGRIVSRFGDLTAAFSQATVAAQPSALGGELNFDGVNDLLIMAAGLSVFANRPGAAWIAKITKTALGTTVSNRILQGSANASSVTERFSFTTTTTDDGTSAISRRPDSAAFARNLNALMPTLVPTVIAAVADWAGANVLRSYIDGALIQTTAFPTAAANSDATPSNRISVGVSSQASRIGRVLLLSFAPTDQQRAVLEAWVAE